MTFPAEPTRDHGVARRPAGRKQHAESLRAARGVGAGGVAAGGVDAGAIAAGGIDAVTEAPEVHGSHRQGLWLIGLFKLSKALFFSVVGVGAIRLIHMDLGDIATRLIAWSHIDSEGRFATFLMEKADLVTHHELRRGALFAFLYAALCMVEGTGLILDRRWAEYFTVVLTAMGLPWEAYEMTQHFDWYKVLLTLVNIGVLLYVLWVLKQKGLLQAKETR